MFPWKKVALATAAGVTLVGVVFAMQTGDPMLAIFGVIVGAMLAGFFGLVWLLLVGLRRPTEK